MPAAAAAATREEPGLPAVIVIAAVVAASGLSAAVLAGPAAVPGTSGAILLGGASLALAAFLALVTRYERREEALWARCRGLARSLALEKALRSALAEATPDLVAVKAADGTYRLTNSALAAALRRPPGEIAGRRDADLLAADEAGLLAAADAAALGLGLPARREESLRLGGEAPRRFSSVRVPLPAPDGAPHAGLLLWVARDVSALAAADERRQRLRRQTVAALTRAVELADPYLVGHSARVRDLGLALAWRLGLGEEERLALELAAGLSQVGKIFVPPEILRKPGPHDARERAVMRAHIDRTLEIVRSIGLEPAVVETLAALHERLDGSGYPAGLRGERIGAGGRVLAVADVFCARTAPRAQRHAEDPADALAWLQARPERFDVAAVAALAELAAPDGRGAALLLPAEPPP